MRRVELRRVEWDVSTCLGALEPNFKLCLAKRSIGDRILFAKPLHSVSAEMFFDREVYKRST